MNDTNFSSESYWLEYGTSNRFQIFQNLMRFRIRNILLVSSLYELFLFEEDGRLYELLREEYQGLNLTHTPELTRVSSGTEAIELIKTDRSFDLVISTLHIEDMSANDLAERLKVIDSGLPVILLAYDGRELAKKIIRKEVDIFDQVFVWQGDFRIIIAMIKYLEDRRNVEHDTDIVGVQSIILVEDRATYYSSFLPLIYVELLKQARRLISEGVNLTHKFLRMRARPKILLCTTYEEAWTLFEKYRRHILGVISDINYKRWGVNDPEAGLKFADNIRKKVDDIPILLHSSNPENALKAHQVGASFLLKGSPTLLQDLRKFMLDNFGFGDFVFKDSHGNEIGRADNLKSLEEQIQTVPDEALVYHSERNHFSKWLKARTEFGIAHKLRPTKLADYGSIQEFRRVLATALRGYRYNRQRGVITDFNQESFEPGSGFARIGGGSIGGKARGLSFVYKMIANYHLGEIFDDIRLYVPTALVLGTDIFDEFIVSNNLHNFALNCDNDVEINRKFLDSTSFPNDTIKQLQNFLKVVNQPLAVRSSSLLEDSQYFPFAGVYKTFMLPNNHHNLNVRLFELLNAIKRVYASTFSNFAKNYFKVTSYRLEEEKMAIVIQTVVGRQHQNRFYPDFSGVAKSYNFYPVSPQESKDGIASVAVGLGKTVVDGGLHVKFCPRYPQNLPQFYSVDDILRTSQRDFYALNTNSHFANLNEVEDKLLEKFTLDVAQDDGTLALAASTYVHENHAIYDGMSREGHRLVTFSPILKHNLFPLPEILQQLLEMGKWAMASPVEIEFAVNLNVPEGQEREFAILQMRPLVLDSDMDRLDLESIAPSQLLCQSAQILGNGVIEDIFDIVVVKREEFDRLKTRDIAAELHILNSKLMDEERRYILIGMGRWGSLDPFLGIPVKWEQISGAQAIVELGFDDMNVIPSQGSHFFHNLTSFSVGYFTLSPNMPESFIDWNWLSNTEPLQQLKYVKHIHSEQPIVIKMNGRDNRGVILKPGAVKQPRPHSPSDLPQLAK